jgi:hypothetical protein
MSDTSKISVVLQRVEQMLDALTIHAQSSADFKDACDRLQGYLDDQAEAFATAGALSKNDKKIAASIVERLAGFQRSAENKGAIPAELQKYIAEQLD